MGCDIHSYAEVLIDGEWRKVGKVFKNPYYSIEREPSYDDPLLEHPYYSRNYDLFAMLANVRNGYGFAGCDTGDGFKPISEPRGLPNDVSKGVKAESDSWNGDGHSHSWLSLRELIKWDGWKLTTTKRGVVNTTQYQDFKENGKPESYCGGVSGRGVEHISNEEMEEVITCPPSNEVKYYTTVSWEESYKDRARTFITETIPELKKLSQKTEWDDRFTDVRLVFFFDN